MASVVVPMSIKSDEPSGDVGGHFRAMRSFSQSCITLRAL